MVRRPFRAARRAADDRTRLGGIAVCLALVAFTGSAGAPGALVGLGLVVAWVVLPEYAVFALGQVGLATVVPGLPALGGAAPPLGVVVLLEAPLVALLFGVAARSHHPRRTAAVTGLALVGFGGLTLLGLRTLDAPWQAGALLSGTTAMVAYGMHRYTVVRFHYTTHDS